MAFFTWWWTNQLLNPHSNASHIHPISQTTVACCDRPFLQAKVTFGRLKFAKPFAKAVTMKTFRLTQGTCDVSSIISQISLKMCYCFARKGGPYQVKVYNSTSSGYNPSYLFLTPSIGVITPCNITTRGPWRKTWRYPVGRSHSWRRLEFRMSLATKCNKNLRQLRGFHQLQFVQTRDVLTIAVWSSGCVASGWFTSFLTS